MNSCFELRLDTITSSSQVMYIIVAKSASVFKFGLALLELLHLVHRDVLVYQLVYLLIHLLRQLPARDPAEAHDQEDDEEDH